MATGQVYYFSFFILTTIIICGPRLLFAENLKAEFVTTKLPTPIKYTTPVYDGNNSIYIFGGYALYPDAQKSEILRYDISSDSIEVVGFLPSVAWLLGTAQLIENSIYYFGGKKEDAPRGNNSDIVKFDLLTYTVTSVGTIPIQAQDHQTSFKFPNSSLVYVYMFVPGVLFECDMSTYTTRKVIDGIEIAGITSVLLNNNAYIFNGRENEVLKVDMASWDTELITNTPQYSRHAFSVSDGIYAYMIGIYDPAAAGPPDFLLQFNPATHEWTSRVVDNLPCTGEDVAYDIGPSSVFVDKLNRIYFFGGTTTQIPWVPGKETYHDDIWYIDLTPAYPVFSCKDKLDGMYPHARDCSKYIWCKDEVSTEFECTSPQVFDPLTSRCTIPELAFCELGCTGKPNGEQYPHPKNCSAYILCYEEILNLVSCPNPLLYDPVNLRCEDPDLVNCHVSNTYEH